MSSATVRLKVATGHFTRKYRYSAPDAHTILSVEQLDQYERDGYLIIQGVLAQEELDKYRKRFVELATGAIPAPKSMVRPSHRLFSQTNLSMLVLKDPDARHLAR